MSRRHVSRGSRASLLALTALLVAGPAALSAAPAWAAPVPVVPGVPAGPAAVAAVAVPGAPTGVVVTSGNPDIGLDVTWVAAPDNGSPITGYTVSAVWDGPVAETHELSVPATSTSAVITGLGNGATYVVTVRAVNAVGTGPASTPVRAVATDVALPGAPRGVTATPADHGAIVRWSPPQDVASGVDHYLVTAVPGGVTQESVDPGVFVAGLTNGTAYRFTVSAVNIAGAGPASAVSDPVTPFAAQSSGGAIEAAHLAAGGDGGLLGPPIDQYEWCTTDGGCNQGFVGGIIMWTPATGAHWVRGAVQDRWVAVGASRGSLGYPLTDEIALPRGGAVSHFQGGSVYFSPATGAHVVRGAVQDHWASIGGQDGYLGYPTSDETDLRTGAVSHFQGGSVYFSPASGAHAVRGAIRDQWASVGWQSSYLGYPLTDEVRLADGGALTLFQGGSVYFSPATGAHAVRGLIRDTWGSTGWERGPLGYPTTDEVALVGGAVTHFQGGSIYFSPSAGAHVVRGAIRDKWASLGWQSSRLGYPVTDEVPVAGGAATHFQGGSIYFSPATGAHVVTGAIRDRWAALGWQEGVLGYPTSDEERLSGRGDRVVTQFQYGSVYFTPSTGAHAVRGAIRDKWVSLGSQLSSLGYPTSEEYDVPGGRRNDFQYGYIVWTPRAGAQYTYTG
jgi:uncharacterized protein with LGFP repeats